jgi:hypothetical protein
LTVQFSVVEPAPQELELEPECTTVPDSLPVPEPDLDPDTI